MHAIYYLIVSIVALHNSSYAINLPGARENINIKYEVFGEYWCR